MIFFIDSFNILVYYVYRSLIHRGGDVLKFDNSIPIYSQIVDKIKKDIVLGNVKIGDKLPSTRDMAVKYSVNPNTVQRVYKELEAEDICYTKRGLGTYINEDEEMVKGMKNEMADKLIDRFIVGMKQLGFSYDEMVKIIETKKLNGVK